MVGIIQFHELPLQDMDVDVMWFQYDCATCHGFSGCTRETIKLLHK